MDEQEQHVDLSIQQWLELESICENEEVPLPPFYGVWFFNQYEEFSSFLQNEYRPGNNTQAAQAPFSQPVPASAEPTSFQNLPLTTPVDTDILEHHPDQTIDADPTVLPPAESKPGAFVPGSLHESIAVKTIMHATGPLLCSSTERSSANTAPGAANQTTKEQYSRPVYGTRTTGMLTNGKVARYRQLINFPRADESLPSNTSCKDILTKYPNHLEGNYLEAFIQYFWTAEMIVRETSQTIKDLWISQGIHKKETPPANFIRNRMDSYVEKVLGEAGLRKLCGEAKQCPSGLPADKEYGRSNPLRLNLNPKSAPSNRKEPWKARTHKVSDA
ncbi:hypothetical protein LTR84_005038 [Exophiala bonariae]|uniref:Uncharacterized protein n=1 Tax=Exophiala bonariae TaxID=1690606 RepID=A0AAV9NP33_9EURO|nr:hypothetical protein LTR84_005038 [Exophiala bonariae]